MVKRNRNGESPAIGLPAVTLGQDGITRRCRRALEGGASSFENADHDEVERLAGLNFEDMMVLSCNWNASEDNFARS